MAAGTGGTVLDADIVVVGAGMVGAACATALLQAGFSTLLVERSMPPAVDLDAEPGLRVSAVSRASDCFLSHIGAWQRVIAARAAPYRRMAVWEHDDGAETLFDAAEIAELTLGHIAENALIQQACVSAYTDAGGEMLCPASVASVSLPCERWSASTRRHTAMTSMHSSRPSKPRAASRTSLGSDSSRVGRRPCCRWPARVRRWWIFSTPFTTTFRAGSVASSGLSNVAASRSFGPTPNAMCKRVSR